MGPCLQISESLALHLFSCCIIHSFLLEYLFNLVNFMNFPMIHWGVALMSSAVPTALEIHK